MQISSQLRYRFSRVIRQRGEQYFRAGRVQIVQLSANRAVARVQGTDTYSVELTRWGGVLSVECTCPYFEDTDLCKHLWATILTVEREDGAELFAGLVEIDEAFPEDGDDEHDLHCDDDCDDFDDDDLWRDSDEKTVLLLGEAGDTREVSPIVAQILLRSGRFQRVEDPASLASLYLKQRWERTLCTISQKDRPRRAVAAPRDAEETLPLYFLTVSARDGRAILPEISLYLRSRKKSGGWALPRPFRHKDISAVSDPEHRQLLAMLIAAGFDANDSYSRSSSSSLDAVLPYDTLDVTLPALCRTGRLRYAPAHPEFTSSKDIRHRLADALEGSPLRLDEGLPWRFRLVVRPRRPGEPLLDAFPGMSKTLARLADEQDTQFIVLDGELHRGEETLALEEPLRMYENGWLLLSDRIARLEHGGGFSWIRALRKEGRLLFPGESAVDALRDLLASPVPPNLKVDPECGVRTLDGEPRPIVSIHYSGRGATLHVTPSFQYDDVIVEAGDGLSYLLSSDGSQLLRRDIAAEERHLRLLAEMGFAPLGRRTENACTHRLGARELPTAVTSLLRAGWRVEAEGRPYRQPGDFQLRVRSGIDWFDLEAEADFGGRSVPLPALLEALERGTQELVLDDGSLGLVPEEWLRQLGLLAGVGSKRRGKLRFKQNQAALLDLMLSMRPEVDVDERFAEVRQELRSFESVEPRKARRGFAGTLRGYQREGLGWLAFLRRFGLGGCLADDMGLGKTVETLAALWELRGEADEHRPSLVVAPKSVVWNWSAEAGRFTPGLRVHEHTGPGRSRDPDELKQYDLLLTTYGVLRRDAALLSEIQLDYAILDEAQAIKNARTATAKAARLLRARHRLALSGTPIENHLGELWSIFEFLNPGMLGRSAAFGRAPDGRDLDDDTRLLLSRALRPYILRRTKEQVAPELPERTEQTIYCDLSSKQRKIYDELREHYRQVLLARRSGKGGGDRGGDRGGDHGGDRGGNGNTQGRFQGSKVHVLEALLRLRQAACHPGLVDPAAHGDGPSAKLDLLMDQLVDLAGSRHKALVFSQFTKLLGLLKVRLDQAGLTYEYLDGRTRKRQAKIERFQADPDLPLFLISLKAGGLGLNLTAADYVFLLDPWWNPAVEAQAIDRAHRIGQTRPVVVYRVISRDTVEAKVLELQERKRALADAIITADNRLIRDLTIDDLELLLG